MNTQSMMRARHEGRKLVAVTCYDHWSARLLDRCDVDFLLVGDSVAMVMYGFDNTLAATVEMIAAHVAAVRRGTEKHFVVADMPFLSFRKGIPSALEAAEVLMRAGASGVKIEGVDGHEDAVRHLAQSGVPVMGHLGLIPQSIHALGGYRVQGREPDAAAKLVVDARRLEAAGCFAIVLECVPAEAARSVTDAVSIPVVGIGAGPQVDGQILVLHDLLGLNGDFETRFVRKFADGESFFLNGIEAYVTAVRRGDFPAEAESFE